MHALKNLRAGLAVCALAVGFAGAALADHHGGAIEAALNDPARPAADKARDEGRKPADVLAFAGVKPGMTVLDVNSATGWYTEVLAHVVGPNGKVYAHNGPSYLGYFKDKVSDRYKDGHLTNVTELKGPDSEAVDLPANSVDAVMMALVYHDYFLPSGPADMAPVLASIKNALKPGGVVIVIDHIAPEGTGTEAGDKLHRIRPAIVREQMEAAGFKFAGKDDVLLNPEDPLDIMPWDGKVSGHTSRFVYKFTK